MIRVQITTDAADARKFLVNVTGMLTLRRDLNEVLADRLAFELRAHFKNKNTVPNKMGADKTNFWAKVADDTNVEEVTETGATVAVAEERFRLQLFGGTIFPKKAKALTIPLIVEARGESAASYQRDTGRKLFTIRGKKALFERTGAPATGEALLGRVRRRNGKSKSVGLVTRTGIRPVFALARSATIKKDPTALPDTAALLTALQQEADDFLADLDKQGGLA